MKLTAKAAKEAAGNVSILNRKMPGSSFAIDTKACHVGSKLVDVEGSVCHKCYAISIQKMYPSVNQAWTANYLKATGLIAADPDKWARMIAFLIDKAAVKTGEPFHRWFDAGDLQSVEMLHAIAQAARLTPHIKHWLPTREGAIVKAYRAKHGAEPANLVIRMSATMIGDKPVAGHEHTSTVHREGGTVHGHDCPAYTAEHRALSPTGKDMFCGPCRACWDKSVPNVSYPFH